MYTSKPCYAMQTSECCIIMDKKSNKFCDQKGHNPKGVGHRAWKKLIDEKLIAI